MSSLKSGKNREATDSMIVCGGDKGGPRSHNKPAHLAPTQKQLKPTEGIQFGLLTAVFLVEVHQAMATFLRRVSPKAHAHTHQKKKR